MSNSYLALPISWCYLCLLLFFLYVLVLLVLLLSLVLVLVLSSMERSLAAMDSLYDDGHCHSDDGVSN